MKILYKKGDEIIDSDVIYFIDQCILEIVDEVSTSSNLSENQKGQVIELIIEK